MIAQKPRGLRLYRVGTPVQIRIYDNGGETADRYTVVYPHPSGEEHPYSSMGATADSTFGMVFYDQHRKPIDLTNEDGTTRTEPVPFGKRHFGLGKRIRFGDLPEPCRLRILRDYREIWGS